MLFVFIDLLTRFPTISLRSESINQGRKTYLASFFLARYFHLDFFLENSHGELQKKILFPLVNCY